MTAAIDAQEKALAVAEEFKKNADARRIALEGMIKKLEEGVVLRDEAAGRMSIIRRTEAKELADGRAAMEVCKSQVQIAWDQHKKVSAQLKVAQEVSDLWFKLTYVLPRG